MPSSRALLSSLVNMQRIILRNSFGAMTPKVSALFFVSLQQALSPDVCIEIGAHEATFSMLMRERHKDIEIFAYEANPAVFQRCTKQYDYARQNIVYLNKAVSDTDGPITINIVGGSDGTSPLSSILGRDHSMHGLETKQISIPSYRGDSLLRSLKAKNAALWIDVEGAAGIVIKGLEQSLTQKIVSSIYIELESVRFWEGQSLEEEVLERLLSYGYVPLFCDDEYKGQHNVILLRQEYLNEAFFEAVIPIYQSVLREIFAR